MGEVVLDTLIKIETPMVMVKPGKKTALFEISNSRGPSLESVKAKVISLIGGRTIVGYHARNRLLDLGVSAPDIKLVNCSTMFNTEGKQELQQQMKHLCQRYLNFREYSRPFPYALTEARACMALYRARQSGQTPFEVPLVPEETKASESMPLESAKENLPVSLEMPS